MNKKIKENSTRSSHKNIYLSNGLFKETRNATVWLISMINE